MGQAELISPLLSILAMSVRWLSHLISYERSGLQIEDRLDQIPDAFPRSYVPTPLFLSSKGRSEPFRDTGLFQHRIGGSS